MKSQKVVDKLRAKANPENVEGMARFGISSKNTLGVSVKTCREIVKEIKKEIKDKEKQHQLSLELWKTEIHEARMLATILDPAELVTEKQADLWVKGIESWDICDGFGFNLIDKTPFAFKKVFDWSSDEKEFIRRAAFSTLAGLAVHLKTEPDEKFIKTFPLIKKYSTDQRNFVKKAVNWALRQIGKRNQNLLNKSIKLAEEIEKIDSKSARWVARDALRELRSKL